MQIARSTLANLCRLYGKALKLPADIDGAQLMWAIAGVESSFGADISPRHENGYCHGGKYFDATRTRAFGCLAHCSYGPWQVMYPNTVAASNPAQLLEDIDACARSAAYLINSRILGMEKATTVQQIAEAYNTGDWRDNLHPGKVPPEAYIAGVMKNYRVPLGELG